MIDEQLAEYVRQQVMAGFGRGDIAKALLAAGWSSDDVNRALIALSVPMQNEPVANAAALPPAPPFTKPVATPAPSIPHSEPPAFAPVPSESVGTSPNAGTPAPEGLPQRSGPNGPLPGVFALVDAGWRIYCERLGTFVGIGVIQTVWQWIVAGVFLAGGLVFVLSGGASNFSMLALFVALALVFIVFVIFIGVTLNFAPFYVAGGHARSVGVKEALAEAWHRSGSLLWYTVAVSLATSGATLLFAGVPVGAVALIALFALGGGSLSAALGAGLGIFIALAVLGVLAVLVVLALVATWFLFGPWLVIEGAARGIGALRASRELVRGRFWPILGRWLGIAVLFVLAMIPILIVMAALAAAGSGGALVGRTLEGLYVALLLVPVIVGAQYTLYESVRSVPTTDARGRGWYVFLAVFGLLIVPALLLPAVLLASLNTARTKGSDFAVQSDLNTIRVESEIYYSKANSYGTAASCAEGMFASDPTEAMVVASLDRVNGGMTLCRADGTAYVVYSPLSSGGWCADSTGVSTAASAPPADGVYSCR
ncbi:hypothetical protein KGQ55_03520 [Patescibacteria group bacterium]|nr:hypothetical protein [Patescibacteria group bacterium]